jgi:hypothetical protein
LLADQQNKRSSSYRHRNQNTDDERRNRMAVGLNPFRSSAFLRCSDAQPEEKFVHRAIWFLAEFGVVRASNIDGQTPVVAEGGEEVVCEARPPNSTVTDFDRVIHQPADLKSSSCMTVIISSHKSTVAMMNSIHSLLLKNHPCTLFMASLLPATMLHRTKHYH